MGDGADDLELFFYKHNFENVGEHGNEMVMLTPTEKNRLQKIKRRRASIVFWESLEETPLMPASKNESSYGSKAHRFIAGAPADMAFLIALCEKLLARLSEKNQEAS